MNNHVPSDKQLDDYGKLLASLGRTESQDKRISVHEAGHAICARLLGHEVGGVTVNPDLARGYEGLCWGAGHTEAFTEGRGDAACVREALAAEMPKAGEDRNPVADIFGSVYAQCIELMAGRAAESILFDGKPAPAADDLRQARELALLICSGDDAVRTFIVHCAAVARDLLIAHGDSVIALATVLRIRRMLNGAEIDKVISDLQVHKAMAAERHRRSDWRNRERSAKCFSAEYAR